jgi:hypothetical protein
VTMYYVEGESVLLREMELLLDKYIHRYHRLYLSMYYCSSLTENHSKEEGEQTNSWVATEVNNVLEKGCVHVF